MNSIKISMGNGGMLKFLFDFFRNFSKLGLGHSQN